MALIVSISQAQPAMFGQATDFVLSVQNTGASAATVAGMDLTVTNSSGQPQSSCNVVPPTIAIGESSTIDASATLYFPFSASFYGQSVTGQPAPSVPRYLLTGSVLFSDDTVSASVPLPVTLTSPVYGSNTSAGAPPNPTADIPAMQFHNPANSAYTALL